MRTRYITLILALLLSAVPAAADFLHIPSLAVDSLYSTCVTVSATNLDADCRVAIAYPEFRPLTPQEAREAEAHLLPRISLPEPQCRLMMSRGEAFLQVQFSPVVYREGRWMRLVSCKIETTCAGGVQRAPKAKAASRYADTSVLASGKWVKVRVGEEGIYRLTTKALQGMGFNDIRRVKLYGYGGRVIPESLPETGPEALPDDLVEVPMMQHGDDLLFFAEGTVRWTFDTQLGLWLHRQNPYSTYSAYFLTEGDDAQRIATVSDQGEGGDIIDRVPYYGLYENDAFGWYEGGVRMYDAYDFDGGSQHTFKVSTPSPDVAGPATLTMTAAAAHATEATNFVASHAGTTLGTIKVARLGENDAAKEATGSFIMTGLQNDNSITVSATAGHHARLNYLRVNYTRLLSAQDRPFAFVPAPSGNVQAATLQMTAGQGKTHLWRIGIVGDATAEVPYTLTGNTLTANIADASRRYVAFTEDADYPEPVVVGSIANQNLHADANIDMVIVVPASGIYDEQAERLADLHRQHDGMTVKVVRADALHNEFSSGTPDASALRRYLKMLYLRASERTEASVAPSYLLLFGPSSWDNRMLTADWKSQNPANYLLAYEGDASDVSIGDVYSYVADDYFALLDDGESSVLSAAPDMAVGRITPYSKAEAKVYVDKIEAYLAGGDIGVWKSNILVMGDYGDNSSHMEDAERVVRAIDGATDSRYNVYKVYPDAYDIQTSATGNTYPQATRRVRELMQKGVVVANYSGHGSPTQLSHAWLLQSEDFKTLSPVHATHWVLASCEIYPIDSHVECFGQIAMTRPTGGAIAFMCATRAVYASYNNPLNCSYMRLLLTPQADGRYLPIGEALRRAKAEQSSTTMNACLNKAKYLIIGDPALRIALPTQQAVIDSINGVALDATAESVQLPAGSVATVSGHVAGCDYDGTAVLSLYDKTNTVNTKGYGSDGAYTYTTREKVIYEGQARVTAGRFHFDIAIPLDISYSDENARVSLYTVAADSTREAMGYTTRLYLNGTNTSAAADSVGPSIYLYLDDPMFVDGGIVGASPLFYAELRDDCGINASGISLGHDITLTIDGRDAEAISLNDYFTYDFGCYDRGQVIYPLTSLSAGMHTLCLKAWDVNNNSSTAQLQCFVQPDFVAECSIHATHNPARVFTNLVVVAPMTAEGERSVAIDIYDASGRLVWQHAASMADGVQMLTTPWYLTTTSGTPVRSGLYICRASITGSDGKRTTTAKKIIVQRQ